MLKDITNTFDAWSFTLTDAQKQVLLADSNQLPKNSIEYAPPSIILGGAYEVNIKNKFYILPEINLLFSTDGKRNVLVPGNPISMAYIRVGVSNFQQYSAINGHAAYSVSPSIGAGVRIKVISIDYTLTNLTAIQGSSQNNGLYSHVISLRLDINVKKKVEIKE
jgi:predicted proteasome-type protease